VRPGIAAVRLLSIVSSISIKDYGVLPKETDLRQIKCMETKRGTLLGTITGLLLLFSLPSQGQSPTAINGRTFHMTISNGTFPFASSGSFRFLPAGSDSRYAIAPISGNIDASSGTHTYTKLAANTARLSLLDNDLGSMTANCTFTSATSGTNGV
jgi:hypothetical protein